MLPVRIMSKWVSLELNYLGRCHLKLWPAETLLYLPTLLIMQVQATMNMKKLQVSAKLANRWSTCNTFRKMVSTKWVSSLFNLLQHLFLMRDLKKETVYQSMKLSHIVRLDLANIIIKMIGIQTKWKQFRGKCRYPRQAKFSLIHRAFLRTILCTVMKKIQMALWCNRSQLTIYLKARKLIR